MIILAMAEIITKAGRIILITIVMVLMIYVSRRIRGFFWPDTSQTGSGLRKNDLIMVIMFIAMLVGRDILIDQKSAKAQNFPAEKQRVESVPIESDKNTRN
ncbi:MAG: hypothetical protein ACAI35_02410 [Candidatus Methylacidiphilales bacterium]|nr:hypothetical protein [Candidatus Methylacidiphilales bacterium]